MPVTVDVATDSLFTVFDSTARDHSFYCFTGVSSTEIKAFSGQGKLLYLLGYPCD